MRVRNNKSIWRVAEFIYKGTCRTITPFKYISGFTKNHYYDLSARLLKKMQNFEFTGEDDHND